MSDMKHTQGEWNWDERPFFNKKDEQFASIVFADGTADEPSGADCCPDDFSPALVFGKTKEECEANAKLIAQSPVMYTFITDWIEAMEDKDKLTIHETALLDSAKQIAKQLS